MSEFYYQYFGEYSTEKKMKQVINPPPSIQRHLSRRGQRFVHSLSLQAKSSSVSSVLQVDHHLTLCVKNVAYLPIDQPVLYIDVSVPKSKSDQGWIIMDVCRNTRGKIRFSAPRLIPFGDMAQFLLDNHANYNGDYMVKGAKA